MSDEQRTVELVFARVSCERLQQAQAYLQKLKGEFERDLESSGGVGFTCELRLTPEQIDTIVDLFQDPEWPNVIE